MRRRWIVALVLSVALVFLVAGTALGYWVLPESKGESGACILYRAALEQGLGAEPSADILDLTISLYDENCR